MVVQYVCRKCKRIASLEEYQKNRHFCPNCETLLEPLRIKVNQTTTTFIKPKEIRREDVNVESLFYDYLSKPIDVADHKQSSVQSWIAIRKQAYKDFREKFTQQKLADKKQVVKDFHKWLTFKNNKSWTTYQRTGTRALEQPERLVNLLKFLQDENTEVVIRVQRGLKGDMHVSGIGQGILTSLLHTFNEQKYGVWNSRTKDTLEILRRTPDKIPLYPTNMGLAYKEVNKNLHELADELMTDLTTLDGFMWYISKEIRFI